VLSKKAAAIARDGVEHALKKNCPHWNVYDILKKTLEAKKERPVSKPKTALRTRKTAVPPAQNFNISIQTLRIAHEALRLVDKPNSQATYNVAVAMQEIEAVLAAVPAPAAPASTE